MAIERSWPAVGLAAALGVAMAGCVAAPSHKLPPAPSERQLPASSGEAIAPPASSQVAPPVSKSTPEAGSKPAPERQKPVRVVRLPAPETLTGKTAAELRQALGAPDFSRTDSGAEIWQYRGNACSLDLFLYRKTGVLRVRHQELRARDGGVAARAQCLDDIAKARATGEQG